MPARDERRGPLISGHFEFDAVRPGAPGYSIDSAANRG
jgi:hypothetical protein